MKRPTAEQLQEYAEHINFPDFDAQEFLDYYDSNGWHVGKTRMISWMATIRTWKRKHKQWAARQSNLKPHPQQLPIGLRNKIINRLNERKARIMRTFPNGNYPQWAKDELAKIQRQLDKL